MKQYKNTVNTSTHITRTPTQLSIHPIITKLIHTHTHTHTHIYIYIYIVTYLTTRNMANSKYRYF